MRLSRQKRAYSPVSFNMTPMIDIVFLLIIFFMTVSQITRTVDLPLPLPRVTSGDEAARDTSITINLNQEGQILIAGSQLSMTKMLSVIKSRLDKVERDANRIKIQIRAHRKCECRHVTELFENLANLGFTNVRSAVSDS